MEQNFKILNNGINATVTERNNQVELYLDDNLLFSQGVDYTSVNEVINSVQKCNTIDELLDDFLGLEYDIVCLSEDVYDLVEYLCDIDYFEWEALYHLTENEIIDFLASDEFTCRNYIKIGPYHILSLN